jgi:hypothetical protein
MEDFIGAVVGIVLLLVGVTWFMGAYPGIFWTIVLIVIGIFIARFLMKQAKEEKARQAAEVARQIAFQDEIISACNESVTAFENIPKDLMTAEQLLDTAESEFQDGAFSPFWDSIERTTGKLGDIDDRIKLIVNRSGKYKALAQFYNGQRPAFPVDPASANRLVTANGTAGRLRSIVRKAQRNFQFATIYEQRKTSAILIAGFANLGEAIDGVGARLQNSIGLLGNQIDDLSSSMTEMNAKVVGAMQDVSSVVREVSSRTEDVTSTIRVADSKVQTAMADQGARQEKANKMLDNIQRNRVPPRLAEYQRKMAR